MLRHRFLVLVFSLSSALATVAQDSSHSVSALDEVPIQHCDRLPVIKVQVDKAEMQFLVDSGATTILNVKSFGGGRTGSMKISSWTGEAATSAREVTIAV